MFRYSKNLNYNKNFRASKNQKNHKFYTDIFFFFLIRKLEKFRKLFFSKGFDKKTKLLQPISFGSSGRG